MYFLKSFYSFIFSYNKIKCFKFTRINVYEKVSLSLFEYISRYETINTNRLHVGIVGYLLDKQVNFYRNSYYKNEAVYDYLIDKKKMSMEII